MKSLLMLMLFAAAAKAQKPGTVQWSLSQAPALHPGERTLTLHADIERGWHVYSATQAPGGPIPLLVRVEPAAPYQLAGPITGTRPQTHQDVSFNLTTEYFTEAFTLDIPIKRTGPSQENSIPLAVRFQMCSDTTCMPPRTVHLLARSNGL